MYPTRAFIVFFSADPIDLSRDGESYVGKVRSNLVGTKFSIYGAGSNPLKPPKPNLHSIIYREVCSNFQLHELFD